MNSGALAFLPDIAPDCGTAGPGPAESSSSPGSKEVDALFASIVRSTLGGATQPAPAGGTLRPDGMETLVPGAEGDPGMACLSALNMFANRHPSPVVSSAPLWVEESPVGPGSGGVSRDGWIVGDLDMEVAQPVMRDPGNPGVVPGAAQQMTEAPQFQNLTGDVPEGMPDERGVSRESILGAQEMETPAEPMPSERTPTVEVPRNEVPPGHGIFRAPKGSADSRDAATVQGGDLKTTGSGSGLELSFDDLDLGANSGDERFFSLNTGPRGSEASGEQTFHVMSEPGPDGTVHAAASSAINGEPGGAPPESPARPVASETAAIRESVLQQLEDESFQLLRTRRNEAEIQLNPPELGKIRLRLSVIDGSVRGFIEVENPAVRSMLQSDLSRLIQSLAEQGLNLGEFDVQLMEDRPRGHRGQAKEEPSGGRRWNGQPEPAASAEVEDIRVASGGSVVDYWM